MSSFPVYWTGHQVCMRSVGNSISWSLLHLDYRMRWQRPVELEREAVILEMGGGGSLATIKIEGDFIDNPGRRADVARKMFTPFATD